jgi:hypothetical protein
VCQLEKKKNEYTFAWLVPVSSKKNTLTVFDIIWSIRWLDMLLSTKRESTVRIAFDREWDVFFNSRTFFIFSRLSVLQFNLLSTKFFLRWNKTHTSSNIEKEYRHYLNEEIKKQARYTSLNRYEENKYIRQTNKDCVTSEREILGNKKNTSNFDLRVWNR